jgi:hypothetical protein
MVIHLAGIYNSRRIVFLSLLLSFSTEEDAMKQSDEFLENAENCAQLAECAPDEPTRNRYKRMEAAWRALAQEQIGSRIRLSDKTSRFRVQRHLQLLNIYWS